MDNSLLFNELNEVIEHISENYIPICFCLHPQYSPESGVGFVIQRKEDGMEFWFHVPKRCYEYWKKEGKIMENINE